MAEAYHHCGLVLERARDGISNTTDTANELGKHQGNRGQDAAGIGTLTPYGLSVHKEIGNIEDGILDAIVAATHAAATLIHNRYKTDATGHDDEEALRKAAHPYRYNTPYGPMLFAENGQCIHEPLLEYLRQHQCDTDNILSDSDLKGRCIAHQIGESRGNLIQAIRTLWPRFDGGHNGIVLLQNGEAAAWRDERGTHSLWHAQHNGMDIITSENHPLTQVFHTTQHAREIPPGHVMHLQPGQEPTLHKMAEEQLAYCIFHWFYFMKRFSVMAGVSSDFVRTRSGEVHARLDANLIAQHQAPGMRKLAVVPIPYTALAVASGMADVANLPQLHAIMRRKKNAKRTFITDPTIRQDEVDTKYEFDIDSIRSYDIFLTDDSIVRGPTIAAIIKKLRAQGFKGKIHVRISFPPVFAPCFYGIEMSTIEELFVTKYRQMLSAGKSMHEVEAVMARDIGADSLRFLPTATVAHVIGLPDDQLCHGCTRGKYPTATGQRLYEEQLRTWERTQQAIHA